MKMTLARQVVYNIEEGQNAQVRFLIFRIFCYYNYDEVDVHV
jgi:hypothetical protein